MKTLSAKFLVVMALALIGLLSPQKVIGQIGNPYPFTNNLNCQLTLFYSVTDPNVCTSICYSSVGIVVAAGGTASLPTNLGTCSPVNNCNIIIKITKIGGVNLTPPLTCNPGTSPCAGTVPGGGCSGGVTLTVLQSGAWIN